MRNKKINMSFEIIETSKIGFWGNTEVLWKDYFFAEKCVSNVEHETSEPQNCYPQTT